MRTCGYAVVDGGFPQPPGANPVRPLDFRRVGGGAGPGYGGRCAAGWPRPATRGASPQLRSWVSGRPGDQAGRPAYPPSPRRGRRRLRCTRFSATPIDQACLVNAFSSPKRPAIAPAGTAFLALETTRRLLSVLREGASGGTWRCRTERPHGAARRRWRPDCLELRLVSPRRRRSCGSSLRRAPCLGPRPRVRSTAACPRIGRHRRGHAAGRARAGHSAGAPSPTLRHELRGRKRLVARSCRCRPARTA